MWDSEKKFCIFVRANYIKLTKHHENYYTEFSTWKWIKNVFCVVKTRKEDDKILFKFPLPKYGRIFIGSMQSS